MKDIKERYKEFAERKAVSGLRKKYDIKTAGDLWYETDKFLSEHDKDKLLNDAEAQSYFEGFEGADYIKIETLINHIKDMPDANVKSEIMSLFGGCVR